MNHKEFSNSATDSNEQKKATPLFARYLENQDGLRVKSNIKAGIMQTLKYPSDRDEDIGSDVDR